MSSRPLWRRLPGYRYPGVGVGGAGVTLAVMSRWVGWWVCGGGSAGLVGWLVGLDV